VIIDVGLCLTFYDFEKIGDSFFMTGDANSYTPVEFRYIVFQPFRGEILQGKIESCSAEGISINMQFFRDILVPPEKLPQVSKL
jgi:DNA-directed RNA polymerase III subunit RPC8